MIVNSNSHCDHGLITAAAAAESVTSRMTRAAISVPELFFSFGTALISRHEKGNGGGGGEPFLPRGLLF